MNFLQFVMETADKRYLYEDAAGIYKITYPETGKSYIGQSVNIYRRAYEHINNIDKDLDYAIYNALREHGAINFEYDILEMCSRDKKILNEKEIYWIAYYDTFYNGYNETPGGDSPSITLKVSVSQYDYEGNFIKSYESITQAMAETGANGISKVCKGYSHTSGGYQWFPTGFEHPINLNEISLYGEREILQYDLEGNFLKSFKSSAEASKAIGVDSGRIRKAAEEENSNSGGYQWKFANSKKEIGKIENPTFHYRKICQYDLDGNFLQIFDTIKDAEKALNIIGKSNITKVCQGGHYQDHGFQWRYFENNYNENIGKCHKLGLPKKRTKVAQCDLETKEIIKIFNSMAEAERELNISHQQISKVCNEKAKSAGGYHWKRI